MARVSKNWTASRIRELLLNEVYIGNMVQGRMKKINYKSKKNIRLPKEQWKVIENTHESIIDKNIFLKAEEMIETRKQTRIKTHDYLLKGLVYCHECGKKLGCSPRKLANCNVYYFRCNTYAAHAKLGFCTPHSIRMDYVEKLVTDKLKKIFQNFNEKDKMITVTKQLLKEQRQNSSYTRELEEYKSRLSKLVLEIDNIYNDKLNGLLLLDDFARIYKRKSQEKLQIQNKIDILKSYVNNYIINEDEFIKNLIKKFNFELTINRPILTDLVDRIEIDKNKKVYVYFKYSKYYKRRD